MLAQMSPRERTLVLIVGSAVALLVNMVLFKFFLGKRAEFQAAITKAEVKMADLKQRESQRALWAERDTWLKQNLPVLGDPQVANRDLAEMVKETARKYTVTIETPNPGVPNRQRDYVALGIRVSAKSDWAPMLDFLRDLQAPGHFIVFDPLDLKVDPNDKTKLRADVTLTKWFAAQQ